MTSIAYKFRVYPSQKQLEALKQFAGCVRFVYNYMLALSKERYEKEGIKWNTFEYKKLLPKLKEEYPFSNQHHLKHYSRRSSITAGLMRTFSKAGQGFRSLRKRKR